MMKSKIIGFVGFSRILRVLNVRESSFCHGPLWSCFVSSLLIEVSLLSPSGKHPLFSEAFILYCGGL